MKRWHKALIRAHRGLYRLLGGRLVGRIGKAPVLLLTTRGRRTGQRRTQPLLYLVDGEALVVVASAGGQATHPAWYLNLVAEPQAEVALGRERRRVHARVVDDAAERARLWALVLELYRGYETYQERTTREIPLVALEPA